VVTRGGRRRRRLVPHAGDGAARGWRGPVETMARTAAETYGDAGAGARGKPAGAPTPPGAARREHPHLGMREAQAERTARAGRRCPGMRKPVTDRRRAQRTLSVSG